MKRPAKPRSRPSGAGGVSTGADPPVAPPEPTNDYDDPQDFSAVTSAASGGTEVSEPVMDSGFGEDEPELDYVPAAPPARSGRIPKTRAAFSRPGSFGRPGRQQAEAPAAAQDLDDVGYGGAEQRGYPGGYQPDLDGEQTGSFSSIAPGPLYEDTGAQPVFTGDYRPSMRSRLTSPLRTFRRPRAAKAEAPPGRQAQLSVARVEPWSVMKFSFVISLVAFIVLFVAVAILYGVLSTLGVFSALERTVASITSSQSSSGFNLAHYLSASRILGYAGLLGAVNVVLITALSTVGAVLYNITADLAGGVEVTLKETD